MMPLEYLAKRNAYWYPAVGLAGCLEYWREVPFSSTHQMDCHHKELLVSGENEKTVLGYLSTIFWGYYGGQNRVIRPERAQGKARLALDGTERKKKTRVERIMGARDVGLDFVAGKICAAHECLTSDHYGDALKLLSELPQLGFAFASKICAFLAPAKCGVIDSVIARRYPQFGFSVDKGGYVKNTSSNRSKYASYCSFLQGQAATLNLKGQEFLWKDRDNSCHAWRAVDVERALF